MLSVLISNEFVVATLHSCRGVIRKANEWKEIRKRVRKSRAVALALGMVVGPFSGRYRPASGPPTSEQLVTEFVIGA
jgi:hypothetical protein